LLASIKRKEEIPGVVIVWGKRTTSRNRHPGAYFCRFCGVDARDRSVGVFEKDVSLPELAAAVNSYPFFSGKSVILLKEPRMLKQDKQQDSESRKEEQLKLAEILGNVPDFCQVVCW
jgi:DNA polymerase-3 subunit delta